MEMTMNRERGRRDTSPPAPTQPGRADVGLSQSAATRILELLREQRRDAADYGLRISLMPGGCSGFVCSLTVDKPRASDLVFEAHGVRTIVDEPSLIWLHGATIDHEATGGDGGFRIRGAGAFRKGPYRCGSMLGG
jgi:iron-sulfur cluster assembly accessory protein